MIVVSIFKDNAEKFADLTTAVIFEACKRRLRLYFSNLEKVREKIIAGEIIDLPFVTFQKDRRKRDIPVENDQRRHF